MTLFLHSFTHAHSVAIEIEERHYFRTVETPRRVNLSDAMIACFLIVSVKDAVCKRDMTLSRDWRR
jgi:hypothetical protein